MYGNSWRSLYSRFSTASGSPNRRVKKEKFEPIQLKDWPEIDMKDITKVSEVMLERLVRNSGPFVARSFDCFSTALLAAIH